MWDATRPFPRMAGEIHRLAVLTVEDAEDGLKLRAWRPFPPGRSRPKEGCGRRGASNYPSMSEGLLCEAIPYEPPPRPDRSHSQGGAPRPPPPLAAGDRGVDGTSTPSLALPISNWLPATPEATMERSAWSVREAERRTAHRPATAMRACLQPIGGCWLYRRESRDRFTRKVQTLGRVAPDRIQ